MLTDILTQGPLFLICLLLMIGVVVVVHELGHYLAGRAYGAAAESFSIGFGKPVFERRDKRGTRWRVNWIPLGGFVKFVGEPQAPGDVGHLEQGPVGKAYPDLGVGARSVIALAGPAANFVLAALLFATMFLVNGTPRQSVLIEGIEAGGPAHQAGLMPGDRFVSVEGKPVENLIDLLLPVQLGTGKHLNMVVERAGERVELTVIPERRVRENGVGQRQPMGTIAIALTLEPLPPRTYNPLSALVAGVVETGDTIMLSGDMLARMVTGREPISNLAGPVGIGDVTRRVVNRTMADSGTSLIDRLISMGWTIVQICALVSVGIGLFNLLPLPVLDGGHLVFNAYEAVTGKALPEKIQEASLTVGLILLLGMFVVITWGDIIETGVFNGVGG